MSRKLEHFDEVLEEYSRLQQLLKTEEVNPTYVRQKTIILLRIANGLGYESGAAMRGPRPQPKKSEPFVNTPGQGQAYAILGRAAQGNVVVRCSAKEAFDISLFFLARFAMPSCLYYNGEDLSLNCVEAGSGSECLVQEVQAFCVGYLVGAGFPMEDLYDRVHPSKRLKAIA